MPLLMSLVSKSLSVCASQVSTSTAFIQAKKPVLISTIWSLDLVSSVPFYMLFMAGAPMLIILVNPDYLQLSMIPGTFLIFSGMIYNVNEEMKALKLNTSYTPLFENV